MYEFKRQSSNRLTFQKSLIPELRQEVEVKWLYFKYFLTSLSDSSSVDLNVRKTDSICAISQPNDKLLQLNLGNKQLPASSLVMSPA